MRPPLATILRLLWCSGLQCNPLDTLISLCFTDITTRNTTISTVTPSRQAAIRATRKVYISQHQSLLRRNGNLSPPPIFHNPTGSRPRHTLQAGHKNTTCKLIMKSIANHCFSSSYDTKTKKRTAAARTSICAS